jgi:hypothetical protein
MFAGVLILAMLGYILNRLLLLIENRAAELNPHVPHRRFDVSSEVGDGRNSKNRVLRAKSDARSGSHGRKR